MSFSAASRSIPGTLIVIATSMPNAPGLPVCGPMLTEASIDTSPGSLIFSLFATAFIAPMKQAEYPEANSCSGLVPGPPLPPSSLGVSSFKSMIPSDERVLPVRPPVEVAWAV